MPEPARAPRQRKLDTLALLDREVDCWVATADAERGTPHLVPLSFLWDGDSLLLATSSTSPTGRNLRANGTVRLGIGPTRDLVLIEGTAEVLAASDVAPELGDAFSAKTGFDPRRLAGDHPYYRVRPLRVQAWREANELEGRELMRDGRWLDVTSSDAHA